MGFQGSELRSNYKSKSAKFKEKSGTDARVQQPKPTGRKAEPHKGQRLQDTRSGGVSLSQSEDISAAAICV